MQLSVFYPFARNHYNLTWEGGDFLRPQEPYNLAEPFKTASKLAIEQRYSFLRYYYTRLFEISRYGGGTFIRPLFFEFPDDQNTLQGYEHSFMVGKALKVSPVLTQTDSTSGKVKSYFPKNSRFISLNDWTTVVTPGVKGENKTLSASWNYTLVHMNEGTIIPYQNTSSPNSYLRTKNLIQNAGISLVIFPDINGHAQGSLYIDQNGDDVNDYALGYYQYYGIKYDNYTIKFDTLDGTQAKGSTNTGNQVLSDIRILGMQNFTGNNLAACAYDNNLVPKLVNVTFDSNKKMVIIQANANDKLLFNSLQAIQFSNDNGTSTFCTPKYMIKSVANVYSNEKNNDIVIKKVVQISAGNTPLLPDLQATFTLVKDTVLRVEITDPNDKTAFRAPNETFNQQGGISPPTIDINAILTLPVQDTEFFYEVHQFLNPKNVLYTTKGQQFIYSKYYKKTTAIVNSNGNIFGLGERVGNFFLDEGVYTLWARDEPSPIENGKRPGKNIYGVHPAYFTKLSTGTDFFAVFDHNAGAQDYILKKNTGNWTITQIKTSGITDQYIILNAPISAVVSEFINLVGKPVMVPEWSLGWHQCRYGYNNTFQVNDVVQKYMANNIPLDVMWTDIDYMDMYRDFTVSTTDFQGLAENITSWKANYGIRYVPIMDAAVAYQPDNKLETSFGRGKSKNAFVKQAGTSNIFIGKVWPGDAVYIDWFSKNAETYWIDEMDKFQSKLGFSGMWIDMNEASNFCDGYCKKPQMATTSIQNKLFYTPGARDLNIKSISIDSVHETGATEYEAHSLYGFYMSKATSKYFSDKKKVRPFVITRSTYTGVGKYASHWLGDNFSTYDYLKYSVGGIYLFGMYGVPVTGADICGFILDTNPQLCARWYALGAFYPFSRNHNDKASRPQEPYVDMFNQTIPGSKMTYTDFIREVSLKRYSMHRYHYSYIHKASTDGTIYFKPLFFNYPDDSKAYAFVEKNILLGDSVKLSPVVDDSTITSFYFPEKNAKWCPLWPRYLNKCFDGQSEQKQQVPYDEVLVHMKSGSIIPLQLRDLTNVPPNVNIDKLRNVTLDLAILCDAKYSASGFVRYDDGETMDLTKYSEFSFSALGASPFIGTSYVDITVTTVVDNSPDKTSKNQKLGSVVVYNTQLFGFGTGSKIKIDRKSGGSVEGDGIFDGKNYILRFNLKDGTEVDVRDIKNIHVSSK